MFCKRVVFRNFAKFTGNHLYQGVYFNKVAGLRQYLKSDFQREFFQKRTEFCYYFSFSSFCFLGQKPLDLVVHKGCELNVCLQEAVVRRCSVKKVFLEISQNSQENTVPEALFLLQVRGLRPATLLKRDWHRCFPVNFMKFLRTCFFAEHLWWLLFVFQQLLNQFRRVKSRCF